MTLDRTIEGIGDGVEPLFDLPDNPKVGDDDLVHEPSQSRRHRRLEGSLIFLLAFGAYLVVAVLLDFKYRIYPADAVSRMANGFYILYSRDPHLAAVGFVWEPLQSIADMVVLIGNHLWPALSQRNMAGSLVSAVSMAGASYQIWAALREWGVSRTPRIVLTALFALNPMIVYYAGNGMSEALFLFTLIASARYLLRWMQHGDLRSLAYSALALALCYLTRNEAALAALAGGLAVGAVSYSRADGLRSSRIRTAVSDLVIFVVPPFTAAIGWAITSYLIIGSFIDGGTLSERLGNQQKVQTFLSDRIVYELHASAALAVFLPILLIAAAVVAVKRRDPRVLAPVAVLGGSLGFDTLSFLSNAITNSLRYWIAVVPLGVLLLGSLVAAIQAPRQAPFPTQHFAASSRARLGITLTAVCLVLAIMIPTDLYTGSAMLNPRIGVDESQQVGYVFRPNNPDYSHRKVYPLAGAMDQYLQGLHLHNGDVLVDNADGTGCVPQMIVLSHQPKLFVIPNDRDFQRVLADPIAFKTRYLLAPDPSQSTGQLTTDYPALWKSGAGFTKMVHRFVPTAASGCPEFRLFHVLRHSTTVT